jgi:hypothetical protein
MLPRVLSTIFSFHVFLSSGWAQTDSSTSRKESLDNVALRFEKLEQALKALGARNQIGDSASEPSLPADTKGERSSGTSSSNPFPSFREANANSTETVTLPTEEESVESFGEEAFSEDYAGHGPIADHFMLGLPIENGPYHSYWGFRLAGANSFSKYSSFNFNLELGGWDMEEVDTFLRFKIGGDLSLYRKLYKRGFFSRITPFAKLGIEYDYFSNEETTTYTTGYDFSPLQYSDYYWEYYESYTTGTSFDFFNYTYSGGFQFELVKDHLFVVYNLMRLSSFDGDGGVTANKADLFYVNNNGTLFFLSYQDADLYWVENTLWVIGVGIGL